MRSRCMTHSNPTIEEKLDELLPLIDNGYFLNGVDVGREKAKQAILSLIQEAYDNGYKAGEKSK